MRVTLRRKVLVLVLPLVFAYGAAPVSSNEVDVGSLATDTLMTGSLANALLDEDESSVPSPSPAGRKYALLVGVGDYPGTDSDLQGPYNDLLLVHDLLVRQYGFSPADIEVLLDGESRRQAVIASFRSHLSQAGPDDIAFFYFSGHGTQLSANVGIDDLEPDGVDEAIVIWGNTGSQFGYLLDDELGILIGELGAGRTLIVLDACNSGTATRAVTPEMPTWQSLAGLTAPPEGLATSAQGSYAPRRKTVSWDVIGTNTVEEHLTVADDIVTSPRSAETIDALDLFGEPVNHVLLAASAPNESSWVWGVEDDTGVFNPVSLFTMYLYAELVQANPYDSFEDVMDRLAMSVRAESLRVFGTAQTPQAEGLDKRGSVSDFLSVE